MSAQSLHSAYQYVNHRKLDDPSVLVQIADELRSKQPDIDDETFAYRLTLKFHHYQPNN